MSNDVEKIQKLSRATEIIGKALVALGGWILEAAAALDAVNDAIKEKEVTK